jgi:hypothetical protein
LTVAPSNNLAPVALFVFNRPDHAERTLLTLQQNRLAGATTLYIFCDGPRAGRNEEAAVNEVRRLAKSAAWCGTVHVIEREENWGLARSIRSGVDRILSEHERVIVLEDDMETSPGFLSWMNDALQIYADDDRVMTVCGYLPQTNFQWLLPQSFFLRHDNCWGWATWRRAWSCAQWDAAALLEQIEMQPGGVEAFDLDGCYRYSDQLRRNLAGEIRTWAVFWLSSIYVRGGLALWPGQSLVRNIGFDDSGENCRTRGLSRYDVALAGECPVIRQPLSPSGIGRWYLKSFHRYGRDSGLLKRWHRHVVAWRSGLSRWRHRRAAARKAEL